MRGREASMVEVHTIESRRQGGCRIGVMVTIALIVFQCRLGE